MGKREKIADIISYDYKLSAVELADKIIKTLRQEKVEITTIQEVGRDEIYCVWFKCNSCEDEMITSESKFCPNCGKKIKVVK